MNRAIEQDLHGLLPALTGPLPTELLNLAASLTAQSRSKASSLKPEEEIARGYACSHLACERLKQSLNLPSIAPRPPVPPRIYKKVYTYIASALSHHSTTPSQPTTPSRTPLKRKHDALAQDIPTTPSRTPSKRATPSASTPGVKTGQLRALKAAHLDAEDGVPSWTMQGVRAVCRVLRAPHAAPHVFTGVSSILKDCREKAEEGARARTRRGRGRGDGPTPTPAAAAAAAGLPRGDGEEDDMVLSEEKVTALITTVTCFVLAELSAEQPTAAEYVAQREGALDVLDAFEPGGKREREGVVSDVEALLRQATRRGWLDMEWFSNIVPDEGGDMDVDEEEEEDEEGVNGGRGRERPDFGKIRDILPDWGNAQRTANFEVWKAGILERLDAIEATG